MNNNLLISLFLDFFVINFHMTKNQNFESVLKYQVGYISCIYQTFQTELNHIITNNELFSFLKKLFSLNKHFIQLTSLASFTHICFI